MQLAHREDKLCLSRTKLNASRKIVHTEKHNKLYHEPYSF